MWKVFSGKEKDIYSYVGVTVKEAKSFSKPKEPKLSIFVFILAGSEGHFRWRKGPSFP